MIDGARVLLTGATGRLGGRLAGELVAAGCELVVVVRARSPQAARERIRAALQPHADPQRVVAVAGDVALPSLGLAPRDRSRLRASIEFVVHAAALTSFSAPLDEARAANVHATSNILAFAEGMPGLSLFAHLSTAFVAGKRIGRIREPELEHESGFQNTYQRSKYEAELAVRSRGDAIPVAVFRPSVVLDERAGSPNRQSAFRFAFELVRRRLLPAVPGKPDTPVDLVTERDAARAITRLLAAATQGETYHVTAGDHAPPLGAIVAGFGVRFLEEDRFAWELSKWRRETPRLNAAYDELMCFICELAYPKIFDAANAEAALGGPVVVEDPIAALRGQEPARVRPQRLGALAS